MNEETQNDIFIPYLGKKVKLFLKGGWIYQGTLLGISGNMLKIDDRIKGHVLVSTDSIATFESLNGGGCS